MADVQKEKGYTPIAHEILEKMATVKMSPTQYRMIFVIWRYTYGFQRKEHDLSLSFLANSTGCDKRQIQRDLKRLEERNIINQNIKNGSYRRLSFNKNYDLWDSTIGKTTNGNSTNGETTNGETTNPTIGKTTNGTIGKTTNQDIYIDNSIDKEEEERNNPFELFESNIGLLSPLNKDSLISWCDDLGDDLVIAAIKLAVKYNARTYKYVEDIFREWAQKNIKTVDEARNYVKEKERHKSNIVNFGRKKTANGIDWDNI